MVYRTPASPASAAAAYSSSMMLGRRTRSLGEGALRTQLSVAQQRIATLEGYIHNREREYHQVK